MTNQPIKLTVGGTVQANEGGTYLSRPADEQLFAASLESQFCYVLACRQIGKSSLMIATAKRLEAEKIRVARIDLTRIGGNELKNAQELYLNFLYLLGQELQLSTVVHAWWHRQPDFLTSTQRFLHFLDQVVLDQIKQPVVIFIDEIDVTLDLDFTDDFFAAIRAVYNNRAHDQYPADKRLTFVLLGVATPTELIKDHKRTPFNIGQAIPIRDFAFDECMLLHKAISSEDHPLEPSQSLLYFEQIYDWTSGHPYLTQKLCQAVMNALPTDEEQLVDRLVHTIFLSDEERREKNLSFVQERVLDDDHCRQMLRIYKNILQEKTVLDDKKSVPINRLKLYGLVVSDKGLKVRNKIYQEVFDVAWTKKHLPLLIPYKQISFLLLFLLILTSSYYFGAPLAAASLIESGFDHYLAGDLESAERDYQWALMFDPDFPEAHYNLGLLYEDQDNFGQAREEYELAAQGKLDIASNNLGRLYILDDKYDDAITVLSAGLVLAEDDQARYALHKNLGWAYFGEGNYDEALSYLQTAIQLDDRKGTAYCLQAQVLDAQQSEPASIDDAWEACLRYGDSSRPDEDEWIEMAIRHFNEQRED